MTTLKTIALDGETVDEVCWRILGKTDGVYEQVLDLNPTLCEIGPRLPAGTVIILPTPSAAQSTTVDIVQLWD